MFALAALSHLAQASEKTPTWALSNEIDSILRKQKLDHGDLGMFIALEETEPLFERNAKKLFIPASVTKLLTAGAVLQNFPPGTKFKTQLWADSPIEENALKGPLYLKGLGDPSFVSESLWVLVNNFIRTGIRRVDGDVLVDDSFFDRVRFDPSRQKERVDRAFDAPTGAMSFNWNSVNVYVRPGKKAGDPARVFLDPENDYVHLDNAVRTAAGAIKADVSVDRKDGGDNGGDIIHVRGKIGLEADEAVVFKNINQPDLWSGYNLKSFLAQRGIQIKGQVKAGSTPSSARLLAEVDSKPIEQVLADMNKFSNNYVAEMLTKHLGTLKAQPGSIANGVLVIRDFVQSLGLGPADFSVVNPSGFTRENRLTAKALWRILRFIQNQFRVEPEFMVSLPIAGIDGTLKKRMRDTAAERWVRAKTGLLNSVVALAGFAGRKDGKVVPFVFLYNGSADESRVRHVFDDVLVKVVENQSGG
ncbi:MAG: D-alanyl-D-alanine carboxypeptidase/D-alanyl-D-alanine-endopeptidase [Bdellovibrio sp.]|nr:MAG: D-alanyl-D-alanine carboxypeptidase/D-alanyl-D-alanine-endopeptidase [Bdellovibrio sp.]